jgi:hypothetical protein
MPDRDPLGDWLFINSLDIPASRASEFRSQLQETLNELETYLAEPPEKINYGKLHLGALRWPVPTALPAQVVTRTESLYRRVYELGGTGNTYTQEGLLNLIALAQDADSVPFWLEILSFAKPRDAFRQRRFTQGLSALALMAIQKELPAAYQGLLNVAKTHSNNKARGLALHYLGKVYAATERPLPEELKTEILRITAADPAFESRFQARVLLGEHGAPVPPDNPGGVYAFKVKFMWDKRIYRTIELRSEQTLDELHFAIQQAIHWDADHLYSFYMNGELYDDRYGFSCPYEEDRPPWTDEAVLGELGLVLGHKFLYYFDYGDSHKFEVEVVAIHPQADDEKYPRVVEAHAEAPAQYGW